MPYVVRGPADLRVLLRPSAVLRPIHKPSVLVRIPGLSPAELRSWQTRLSPLAEECGCRTGAQAICLFLLCALVAMFASNVPDDKRFSLGTYAVWAGLFLGGLIGSALLGKLFGQLRSAMRLKRACDELERRLADETVPRLPA